jgi:hypothetical protein
MLLILQALALAQLDKVSLDMGESFGHVELVVFHAVMLVEDVLGPRHFNKAELAVERPHLIAFV